MIAKLLKKSIALVGCICFSSLLFAEDAVKIAVLPDNVDFWSDYPADILADTLADRMTDDELLSQILMFGWAGAEPSELLNQWVTERGLGSVKVFGWNTDNIKLVAKAVKSLQE